MQNQVSSRSKIAANKIQPGDLLVSLTADTTYEVMSVAVGKKMVVAEVAVLGEVEFELTESIEIETQ